MSYSYYKTPTFRIAQTAIQYKGLVINYREGGGLQNGKIAGPKPFAPPPAPSRQGKTFRPPPPFKRVENICAPPPFNTAKISSYRLKLPQNFLCPHFSTAKRNSAPLFVGVKLHMPPLPFCSPLPRN